jgi:hypothetical protein
MTGVEVLAVLRELLIPIGGLVVAGMAVWLSYKSRLGMFKENVYRRQMKGYESMISLAARVFHAE